MTKKAELFIKHPYLNVFPVSLTNTTIVCLTSTYLMNIEVIFLETLSRQSCLLRKEGFKASSDIRKDEVSLLQNPTRDDG